MKKGSAVFAVVFALALPFAACKKESARPRFEPVAVVHVSPVAGEPQQAEPPLPSASSAAIAPPDPTPPADAEKTPSGLVTKVLRAGRGRYHPGPNDRVVVDYTGWTRNGHMFHRSLAGGQPTTLAVGKVIPGWAEGLQLMVEGEKRRMWIPTQLAYGLHPPPGAPAGELVLDVELEKIVQPPAPTDLEKPPKTARTTRSGLTYEVLQSGTGTLHPTPNDRVTVNYTGWTLDGHMFDSSAKHGGPETFRLVHLIKGWVEGVQLMVVGEKVRFWIPPQLAYGASPRPGVPAGKLVFDVELLAIH